MQLLQASKSKRFKNRVSFPVKQKQAELDDLNLKLHYTQKYSETLHDDVKAKKNFNQKTRTQKKIAVEQKLEQVSSWLRLEIQSHTGLHSVLLINHLLRSSGFVCRSSDKGAGESDGADKDVWSSDYCSIRKERESQKYQFRGKYTIYIYVYTHHKYTKYTDSFKDFHL